jgi:BAI1-associated protein 3
MLKCLHLLHCLRWRTKGDVVIRAEEAVVKSVREWHAFVAQKVVKAKENRRSSNAVETVANLTKLTHLLIADLASCRQRYAVMFSETLNIDYVGVAKREYEGALAPEAQKAVEELCDQLKSSPPAEAEVDENRGREFDLSTGTRLFEFYLALQQFYDSYRSQKEEAAAATSFSYHKWFIRAVAKWLDIALFKAIGRITKAVELDDLRKTVDDLVMHTPSAIDISTVFDQIKTFWRQLQWPDAETAYVFISRILDDVCRAAVFYAERMCAKVERVQRIRMQERDDDHEDVQNGSTRLEIGTEQCFATNNMDYVLQVMSPLADDLGMGDVLQRLEACHGGLVADACRKTVRTLVKNAVENVENQIHHVRPTETIIERVNVFVSFPFLFSFWSSLAQRCRTRFPVFCTTAFLSIPDVRATTQTCFSTSTTISSSSKTSWSRPTLSGRLPSSGIAA